jgi:hypothetical protein
MKTLQACLGRSRGMINEAEKRWPGVKAYMNATGLDSDPRNSSDTCRTG